MVSSPLEFSRSPPRLADRVWGVYSGRTMNLAAVMSLNATGFINPLAGARSALGGVTTALQNIGNLGNVFTGIRSAMELARSAMEPLAKSINAAGNDEALRTTFTVLLRDGEKAKSLMRELTQFADVTPFEPEPVMEAGKALVAFGFEAAEVKGLLRDAGDAASAMGRPIEEAANAFGRVKAGQFGEAFEMFRRMGISMQDLQAEGLTFDKGGSFLGSASQAMDALRRIIQRKFGGTMEEVAQTWNGKWSTLQGNITAIFREFGKPLTEALKPALDQAIAMSTQLAAIAKDIGTAIAPIAANAAAGAMSLAKGLVGALKTGQIGELMSMALQGAVKVFMGSLAMGVQSVIQILSVGLRGVIQTSVAVLRDESFWGGLKSMALSIAYEIKAILQGAAADLLSMIPGKEGLADEWRRTAESTRGVGEAAATQAGVQFEAVDYGSIMAPMLDAGREAAKITMEAITQIGRNFANIPEFAEVSARLQALAAEFGAQAQSVSASVSDAQSGAAGGAKGNTPTDARGGAGYRPDSDALARVGGMLGAGSPQITEQRRTNTMMAQLIDLTRSGLDFWRNLNPQATWA